ncbi:hypothetical protein GLOIN_2v1848653 [Rhizophagus irregularis DAOM 181602=DAOM 197198]|nr:hypothetical protein GLOIN_2v1848653 [Rhizophagus irregularis DAOM 181602=DAOM 197198]
MQELCSALLLKVSETMPPGEPGGPSPPHGEHASRDIEGNSNKKHVRESDEILEISDTNNTNEDFCSTLKNDKKRVKIGNTSICKKVTKPDKESLLAISFLFVIFSEDTLELNFNLLIILERKNHLERPFRIRTSGLWNGL